MRYPEAHAAKSGSVPFVLRGPKTGRRALATAVAVAIGVTPAVFGSPAFAAPDSNLTLTNTNTSNAVVEGGSLTFSLVAAAAATYTITTNPGGTDTAVAGVDYQALTTAQQTITFSAAGTQTITIPTTDDALYENAETVTLRATNGIYTNDVTATINDNDAAPSYTLTASPNPVTEAVGAKTTVTAKLSTVSGRSTTVTLATANGTAVSGTDYTALSGTVITIPAGSLTATADVLITNDSTKDQLDTETFTVNGTGVGVSPANQAATVSIVDAQSAPKVTLSGGGSVAEGSAATFTVTTDTASELPIAVNWNSVTTTPAANHGLAVAGEDFSYPSTRTATIPAGSTTTTISIPTTSDMMDEPDEDFAIEIATPTNAVLGTTTKVAGTITDGDSAPTVTFTPTTVTEGDTGKKAATFTATLSAKSGKTVKVNWATGATGSTYGDAIAGKDYVAANGTLTFAPGTTTQTFTVDIIGDTIDEGPATRTGPTDGETFNILPTAVAGEVTPSLGSSSTATIKIVDDDAAPTWSFGDLTVKEGDDTNAVLMPIKLVGASDHPIQYTIADLTTGTAKSTIGTTVGDNDYQWLNTTVSVAPEMMAGYAAALVVGDHMYEGDETVNITATPGATTLGASWLATATADPATLTLTNDDKAPDLEIDSIKGKEGETVDVMGTVTGSSQSETKLTVSFMGKALKDSKNNTKAADEMDFTNPGAKVITIPAGTVPGTKMPIASIPLLVDKLAEPVETIVGMGVGLGNVGTVTDGYIYIDANGGSTEPGEPGETTKPTISVPSKVVGAIAVDVKGKAPANTTVELWGAPMGEKKAELKWIANTKSDKDGWYSFSRWIGQGYRFVTQANEVNSDEAMVWVQQNPVFLATSPSKGWVSLAVQGSPRGEGQTVIIQRWVNGEWENTKWRGTTGKDNLWKAMVKQPSGSVWNLRAFVAGYTPDGILPGYTMKKTLTVS